MKKRSSPGIDLKRAADSVSAEAKTGGRALLSALKRGCRNTPIRVEPRNISLSSLVQQQGDGGLF